MPGTCTRYSPSIHMCMFLPKPPLRMMFHPPVMDNLPHVANLLLKVCHHIDTRRRIKGMILPPPTFSLPCPRSRIITTFPQLLDLHIISIHLTNLFSKAASDLLI